MKITAKNLFHFQSTKVSLEEHAGDVEKRFHDAGVTSKRIIKAAKQHPKEGDELAKLYAKAAKAGKDNEEVRKEVDRHSASYYGKDWHDDLDLLKRTKERLYTLLEKYKT